MKLALETLIKKHTAEDGTVDFKKAQEDFQTQWNGFDAKQNTKLEEQLTTAKSEGVNTFIAELGIENVKDRTGFTKYAETLKTSATDKDTAIVALNEKYKDFDANFEALKTANGTILSHSVKKEIGTKFGKDYIDDVFELIGSKITEEKTAEVLVKEYAENPKYNSWLNVQKAKVHVRKTQGNKEKTEKKLKNQYAKWN